MTKYACSPWVHEYPKSRVPTYARYRGDGRASVVVVGGGLTGCATAYAFAAAGIEVTLLEASRLGHGVSGSSSGWIADDPGVGFTTLEETLGLRAARHAWEAWRRAALDFSALARRLKLTRGLESRDTLSIASTPEQAAQLTREQKARRGAGLNATLVSGRAASAEAGTPVASAVRGKGGAVLDPYRATLGLAAAAAARGASIHEGSEVTRIRFDRKAARVHTATGVIQAGRVVIATGAPTALHSTLVRHFALESAFLTLTERVPAAVRRRLGSRAPVIRDQAAPPHVIRWVDDEWLLVAGADAPRVPDRLRAAAVVQRTGQLMYELSTIYPDISGLPPQYGWEVPFARTADGLPFIGPHRNHPHQLFAWGGPSHAVTGAYLASRILLRHHLGALEPGDEIFGFRLEKRS